MPVLPVSLDDLIHARTVESVRLEFKASWTDYTRGAIRQTVCAFANDFQGLNGGYVVIGIADSGGKPVLPPVGIDDDADLETIQTQIRGDCNRIEPIYQPVISPELFMGKRIIVLYCPMGDARPYQAPEQTTGAAKHPYVRLGPSTVDADTKVELRNQLYQVTARVPFDERRRSDVPIDAVSPRLLAKYLEDVGSRLNTGESLDARDTLRRLRLTGGVNGSEAPRNTALLFFTELPDEYLPNAMILLAQFRDDAGGELIEQREFRGPLQQQALDVFAYLESLFGSMIQKSGGVKARRFVAYPDDALREVIVNAIFHRSYDVGGQPTRIALYPDRLEITSYPGPVPGVELMHFFEGARPPQVPPRNPRIGELLRALRLAETWHSGIPRIRRTMRANGSPAPAFSFDVDRTYFQAVLPAHPGYVALHAMREAATLWHTGERARSVALVEDARRHVPESGSLAAQLIEYLASTDDLARARAVLTDLEQTEGAFDRYLAYIALARAYVNAERDDDAQMLLENIPADESASAQSVVDLAILQKRTRNLQGAHTAFSSVAPSIQDDPKALHEFAQVKLDLARDTRGRGKTAEDVKRRLSREAVQLLQRVIRLAQGQSTRQAWAWYNLAQARNSLHEPTSAVLEAIDHAIRLLPGETKFHEWKARHAIS